MSWLTGNWSLPIRLSEIIEQDWARQFVSDEAVYLGGGVYRLIGLTNEMEMIPAVIHRVCGDDPEGTLYIGASDTLMYRVSALIRTHRPDFEGAPHKPMLARMAINFPAHKLAVSWELLVSPWDRESELLGSYGAKFGELPPHNRR